MLACFMCHDPRFFNGTTLWLLLFFGLVAFAVSPACSSLTPAWKRRTLMLLPPGVLVSWFFLQRELLLTNPMMWSCYRSMWGITVWKLNSAIFIAFGIAFALRIVRTPGLRHRIYGLVCMLAFLPLLIRFGSLAPVTPTEGIRYRVDAWLHPPAREPFAEGKSLSYWARRVDGLAEESEPALSAIRSMGPEGVEALLRAFRTGNGYWTNGEPRPRPWEVRQHAAEALVQLGPDSAPAVPLMIESLRSPDRTTREQAAGILGAAGEASPEVISALMEALADDDTDYYAMNALVRLSERAPGIVRQLAEATKGSRPNVAYWAMVALSEIGPASQPVLGDLIVSAQQDSGESRQHAVQAIGLIGTNAAPAVPALIAALGDSREWTRKCSYIALGRIGPFASNALPALRSALTNESYLPARMDIARALWRIDPGQLELVLPAIAESLDAGQRELKEEQRLSFDFLSALDLIGEIGPDAIAFVPRLRQCLASGDTDMQLSAACALWRVLPAAVAESRAVLRKLVGLENYAQEWFGSEDWERGLAELKQKRESFHPRIAAMGTLWQMDEKARPVLVAELADLLRDWDYFTSMKGVIPQEAAAISLLIAIENDPSLARVHDVARRAQRTILGGAGERW